MFKYITNKINSLPPLPKTLILVEKFNQKPIQNISELVEILEQDPLICATLLKYSNSAIFGFRNKVETTKKAVELLGITLTCSITFGIVIKSSFNITLNAYNLSIDKFMELSSLSTSLLQLWLKSSNQKLLNDLLFPAFLSKTGMFILSDVAKNHNQTKEFYDLIKNDYISISKIENEIFGITSTQITAFLFKQWNLSDTMINTIKYVDNIDKCNSEYLEKNQILKILKILTNPIHPLDDKSIEVALGLSDKYNLDTVKLKDAIDTIQIRLLDAK